MFAVVERDECVTRKQRHAGHAIRHRSKVCQVSDGFIALPFVFRVEDEVRWGEAVRAATQAVKFSAFDAIDAEPPIHPGSDEREGEGDQ